MVTFDAGSQVLHVYIHFFSFSVLVAVLSLTVDSVLTHRGRLLSRITERPQTTLHHTPSLIPAPSSIRPPLSQILFHRPFHLLAERTDEKRRPQQLLTSPQPPSLSRRERERERRRKQVVQTHKPSLLHAHNIYSQIWSVQKKNIASKVKFCVGARNCCNGTKKNTLSLTGGFL